MYRVLLISILLCLKTMLLSQSTHLFNKIYDVAELWDGIIGVSPQNTGGYFCIAKQSGGTYQDNKITLWGLDELGDEAFRKQIFEDSIVFNFGRNPIQRKDGSIWMAGGRKDIKTNISDGTVYKFFENGELLLLKSLPLPEWGTFDHVASTNDGNLAMCGVSKFYSQFEDVYLAKMDTLGNEIWSVVHESPGWQRAHCMVPLADGGFMVAVTELTDTTYHTNMLVMKFDSTGNFLWEKELGGTEDNSNWPQIGPLADGNLFFTSGNTVNGFAFPYVAKLTPNGETIWEHTFTQLEGGHFITPGSEKPNGHIVIAGNTYDDMVGNYSIATMTELTETGEIEWHREYQYPPKDAYFWGMCPSNEGGWVGAGTTLKNYPITKQDAWVVKMDEFGNTCPVANCDTAIIVRAIWPEAESSLVNVFPNPNQGEFQISTSESGLNQANFYLFDITGHEIWKQTFAYFPGYRTLHFSDLAAGIYFLHVESDKGRQFVRVVVQK